MAEYPKDNDIEENRLAAAMGYLWVLCLVPLLSKKKSKFARFHGKQGLVLLIAWFALWLIGWIPVIGWFALIIGGVILAVLALLGIVNALQGNYWEMPILGEYAKKIKL